MEELKELTKDVLAKLERLSVQDQDNDEAEAKTKTRVRTRKAKIKGGGEIVASSPAAYSESPIDHTLQFLLEIVQVPQDQWATVIRDLAVQKGVIRVEPGKTGKNRPKYSWNPSHTQNEHTQSLIELINGRKKETRDRDKRRKFQTLTDCLNELISDKKLHVHLSPARIRNEAELDQALTRIADMLVAAGLGYVEEGEIFVTKQGMTAFVRTNPEVVIRKSRLRRCALNGDIVRVFIFRDKPADALDLVKEIVSEIDSEEELVVDEAEEVKEIVEELSKSTLTGFVIRIVRRVHPRTGVVGQFGPLQSLKAKNLIFFPHERGIPPVNVDRDAVEKFATKDMPFEEYLRELPKQLVEMELSNCNSFYNIYYGHPVSHLGTKGNVLDENACILLRHGFRTHAHDRMERLGQEYVRKGCLPEALGEAEMREDLTKMCIFTIDPATARDLDDAVSCRQLENGNYEVGVHISDVTNYVVEDSDLDQLVRQAKTTSVYMVDQVYHMLPSNLCQQCSLLPSEEKRAVSVFVELTPQAEVVSTRYTRSLINSCCQLSYEQAQKIIDDEDPLSVAPLTIYNGFSASDLRTTIKALHKLARVMRDRRMRNGALKFDKPKYYFRLDADNEPVEVLAEQSKPANHLIEEFMILANQLVGEYIYRKYPQWAILRQHSPPKLDQMAKVKAFFRDLDFPELHYGTPQEINASMAALLDECERRQLDRTGFELVLNGMLAKPMNRAQYFCTGDESYADRFNHFALSIPFYTHFTSPIRRYPDILVHRLLIRALRNQPAPKTWHLSDINALMGDCNRQKMNSRYASEDSARLFFMHYLRKHHPQGLEMRATVCNLMQRSLEVKLWQTGDELNVALVGTADNPHHNLVMERTEDSVRVKKMGPGTAESAEGGSGALVVEQEVELRIFSTCTVLVTVEKESLRATLVL